MATSNSLLTLRRHDLDNLRSFLTKQVIVHHTALTYGGLGNGNLSSALFGGNPSLPLTALAAFDQSFFMGLFFWISGRGAAQSLLGAGAAAARKSSSEEGKQDVTGKDRGKGKEEKKKKKEKGPTQNPTTTTTKKRSITSFLHNRLIRLLLPAVGYTLVLNPAVRLLVAFSSPSSPSSPSLLSSPPWSIFSFIATNLKKTFLSLRGIRGSVWYTATLFCFDAVAAGAVHVLSLSLSSSSSSSPSDEDEDDDEEGKKEKKKKKTAKKNDGTASSSSSNNYNSYYRLISTWGFLPVATLNFLVRLRWYPVGKTLPVISVQPGYICQYIFAYGLGFASHQLREPRILGVLDHDSSTTPTPTSTSTSTTTNNNNNSEENEQQQQQQASKSSSTAKTSLVKALTLSILTMPTFILLPRLLPLLLPPHGSTNNNNNNNNGKDWLDAIAAQIPGGWDAPAALYALWSEFSFSVVAPALMRYFADEWNDEYKPKDDDTTVLAPRFSYAAFLVHTPVSVVVEMLVDWALLLGFHRRPWMRDSYHIWQTLGPVVMTAVVGGINVYASYFAGAKVLEWFPVLRKYI